MVKKVFATDSEIQFAHDLLLAGKPDFEEDKVDVIKCDESRDVKACPGSGKTTVLLAKLLILSERMPFKDGSGICVITHTNVAVNEIRSRFGRNANVLFSYPNFCGTIQSFVDQFLTIPWYNSFNDKPLVTVDDDRANAIIRKEFYDKGWKEQQKSKSLLYGNPNYKKACDARKWDIVKQMEIDAILPLFYDYASKKFFRNYNDNHVVASYNPRGNSDLFQILEDVRLKAYRSGILQYQDAYSIALGYLALLPEVKQSLTERFKYVFLDEAQDSNQMQLDLIDGMFERNKTVVQRFGDPYQSLYDSERPCAWKPRAFLQLNNSKRFGSPIAKVLQTVCIDDNRSLQGNADEHSVKPVMIVYEDASKVLPKFVDVLKAKIVDGETVLEIARRERSEDTLHRYNIKAIGHVGNKKDEKVNYTSIKQYYPQFESSKVSKYPFQSGLTLNNFLQKDSIEDKPLEYRNSILDAIIVALERVEVKKFCGVKFNKTSLLDYLKEKHHCDYEKLLNSLSSWVMKMSSSELRVNPDVFDEVKKYITGDLASILGYSGTDARLTDFLQKEPDSYYSVPSIEHSQNIYKEGDVEIEVATVHSVKGETHAATLYLETMYYAYESQHFGKQLCGEVYIPRKGDSRIQACLKVAYVGMSRPKYLLCYAINKERFNVINCKELGDIWEVQYA